MLVHAAGKAQGDALPAKMQQALFHTEFHEAEAALEPQGGEGSCVFIGNLFARAGEVAAVAFGEAEV